jgi:hypothetical protein
MKIKLVIELSRDRYLLGLDDPDITILTDHLFEYVQMLERNDRDARLGILHWYFERGA